jgi:hypothetical protein
MTFESEPGRLSPAAAPASPTRSGREPGVRLRDYGVAVQVTLLLAATVNVLEIPALLHRRALASEGASDPRSISLSRLERADHAVSVLGKLETTAFVLAAIAFLAWFYVARKNADGFASITHRRARPWAFWGWICPIVNLWFPYEIATDTLRASDRMPGSGRPAPDSYLLINLWWGCFIVLAIFDRMVTAAHPPNLKSFPTHDGFLVADSVMTIITAVLAILVVRRISASNDRFRHAILAAS